MNDDGNASGCKLEMIELELVNEQGVFDVEIAC